MAYAAVSNALDSLERVVPFFQSSERKQLESVHPKLKFLLTFLDNSTDRLRNHSMVKPLEVRIRDVAYDAEDCIDNLLHSAIVSTSEWPLGSLSYLIEEIDDVNKSVLGVYEDMYNMKQDDRSSFQHLSQDLQEDDPQTEALKVKDWLISSSKRLQIVQFETRFSKRSLAHAVLTDPSFLLYFHRRAWTGGAQINHSRDFLRAVLLSLISNSDLVNHLNDETLRKLVYQCLHGTRYLIVIDSALTAEAWTYVKLSFPDDWNGSRILLLECDGQRLPHWLIPGIPPELSYIKMEIERNREGLPPDIVADGRLLLGDSEIVGQYELGHFDRMSSVLGRLYQLLKETEHDYRGNHLRRTFRTESTEFFPEDSKRNQENIVVGLDESLTEIVDRLTGNRRELEILTIIGMGGIGKTTLVKKIFSNPWVVYHFYIRLWTTVSQNYDVRELLLQLLQSEGPKGKNEMPEEELAAELYRTLKGQRYLVVIDDMRNNKAWDDVRRCFPNDRNGSRIVLTSRLRNVAAYVNPENIHDMKFLTREESVILLERKVFNGGSIPLELMGAASQIADKCEGLPLSLVVIAGVLSKTSKSQECWENVAKSVASFVTSDQENVGMIDLSYQHLPHHLKACLLYMVAFPEDSEIGLERLFQLWIGEGLLRSKVSKSLEEIAEEYLSELIDRSLILIGKRSSDGGIKTCCVHDTVRHFCLRISQEEKFLQVIDLNNKRFSMGRTSRRRLSFHSDNFGDVHLVPPLPLARSFLFFTVAASLVPDIFFFNLDFKFLKVLDIVFLRFEHFPEQIVKLVLLRYLALTATFYLPSSICELKMLQILTVEGPWISMKNEERPVLALEFWQLVELRHLRLRAASYLPAPVTGIELLNLLTLSVVRPWTCTVNFLMRVPNVKKIKICETHEDFKDVYPLPSTCLENLVRLPRLETVMYSSLLDKAKVRTIPYYYEFPSTLKKLTLTGCYLSWKYMASLGKLPCLEVLKLRNYAFQGSEWEPNEEGFLCLKHLLIDTTDLVHWKASSIHFPRLQRLILVSCASLEEIPNDIAEIPTLELIELQFCSSSSESSALRIHEEQKMEGNDYLDVRIRSSRCDTSLERNNPP